tara:strand:- start:989 stop:1132 length:144 start_codon:yes stop_codon:yes gene_type:complete
MNLNVGDWIAKLTKVTGIKWLVKKIYKDKDCGCDKRQESLNQIFKRK